MPTAKICLRNSRWYYLFVFYSLISCTETFYIMETSTKPNLFATYGLIKKKDYKAELLKELAEEEDIYLATSTIHFFNRLKTMKYKYVTDSDVDETTTPRSDLMDTTGSSKIQNKSLSLKNKTMKTFDSLWNMVRTLSDDSWSHDKMKDRKTSAPYPEQLSRLKKKYSSTSALYEYDYDYEITENNNKRTHLTKASTIQSKFKGSKRKKKTKSSNHKKKKGYKSNSTDKTANIVNISVHRINTRSCRCHFKKHPTKVSFSNTKMGNRKKMRLANPMKKQGKNQEQTYKVNNTIMLNVNANGACGCRKKTKKIPKGTTNYIISEMQIAVTIPTTTKTTPEYTTTQSTTQTTKSTTQSTTQPTTQFTTQTTRSTTQTTRCTTQTTQCTTQTTQCTTQTTQKTTQTSQLPTNSPTKTTEIDECGEDIFTCDGGMKLQVPNCLCSKNLMKQLSKVQVNNVLFKRKRPTKLKKCETTCCVSPTDCACETEMSLNVKTSKRTSHNITVIKEKFNKTLHASKKRRKHTTVGSLKKKTSNWFHLKKKHSSFSTSTERNDKTRCNRMKCTTFKAKNDTTTSFQVRPSLTEDSEAYDDDMKETEYYEEYYENYDEQSTISSTLADEQADDGNEDVQASLHYDIDGSTIFPEDDPALSAHNILHLLPFNHGKSSTVDSEYEEDDDNKHITDLNPNSLESLAKKIYNTALRIKNDLDENRSARIFMEKKEKLVKNSMQSLNRIQKRCNYLLREINISRKAYIRKLQQLLGLSKVRDQVEKRIKGKLNQILYDFKRRDPD